jgi:hypothetical protein
VGTAFTEIEYLTTRSRVLLEKVIFGQHVKKFPEFDINRSFIAVFTRTRHWSLS